VCICVSDGDVVLEKKGKGQFLRKNWWMDESGGGMEEANRMLLGLFHNYLFSHIHDPHLVKVGPLKASS
jgi:hypothetical protein